MAQTVAVLLNPNVTQPEESEVTVAPTPEARVNSRHVRATTEPKWVQTLLTLFAVGFLTLFVMVPLGVVFTEAFRKGLGLYRAAILDPDALSAILLTLKVAAIVVPLNCVFGIAAAWAVAKFRFVGRSVLITLIDLPFAVSPVISGLIFVLMFGRQGVLGPWLEQNEWQVIFAIPGIVLASAFVTFPLVARELISFMEAQGTEEEEAAIVLGASGLQTFWRVTLPNIKWGLLYGLVLCNARAMGEFGAVSVVSGHIRGKTNTIPLHVEILYNDYKVEAAFAVATILTFLGVITLIIKQYLEYQTHRQLAEGANASVH